jgi:hypothetical protein
MDHQGAGRSRPAADTRRQDSWPWPGHSADGGPQAALGPPTGPQPAPGTAAGPQPRTGPLPQTGPQPGSGPLPQTGPQPGSGPLPQTGPQPGSGPQRELGLQGVSGAGTGAQRRVGAGSGAQPVLGDGTGGQPTLGGAGLAGPGGRTPVRGFPPGYEQAETPPGGFWYPPRDPLMSGDGGPGSPDDTDPIIRVDPRPPHTNAARTGGRRSAKAKRRRLSRAGLLAMVAVVVLAAGFGVYRFFYEPRVNAPVSPSLRLPTSRWASGSTSDPGPRIPPR